MNTKIQLGSSGSIDLLDDVAYSLNYSIADIREPDKRNANFSKTITIPGSATNNKLFAHIFEVTVDSNFNPNLKTPAKVFTDDIEVMDGYLRLLKINVLNNQRVSYEVNITGNVGSIFIDMGESLLSDLDYSEFNHTYNRTNQRASWTAQVGAAYVYPFIDYGQTNGTVMDVKNFFPALYVKQYIDKICSAYGYSYTSTFMDSERFKRLIIPYNGKGLGLTDAQIDERLFYATIGSSGSIAIPQVANTYTNPYSTAFIPYNSESLDPSNLFNTSTYRYVANKQGNYSFNASFNYQLNSTGVAFGWALIIKVHNGVPTMIASAPFSVWGGITEASRTAYIGTDTLLEIGDEVYCGVQIYGTTATTPSLNVSGGYFYNKCINTSLFDGDALDFNTAIPLKIKQKDFFTSIVKMFNLYIETDKNSTKKLYIEPRDDFYSLGVSKDWTSKLDVSQDLIQTPMGELDTRKFVYTYTDDKDYYNTLYKNSYLEAYGTRNVDINNEFLTGKRETKVIFSPTPLVNDASTDRVVSKIFSVDNTGNVVPKESNIRILYYGGNKDTVWSWNYTSAQGTFAETIYPYAGHLDSVTNPTFDLSFAVPFEVYYQTNIYTDSNLYNIYHRKFLLEIVDKDSKIVTGFFRLNPVDIYLLDFRNTFYVQGVPLRLNKIYDYNPVTPGLTKCEFIKIKFNNTYVTEQVTSVGGVGVAFNNP